MQTMTLQEFITESLVNIVEGVRAAQTRTGGIDSKNGSIKPSGIAASFTITEGESQQASGSGRQVTTQPKGFSSDPIQKAEFDIAVTVERKGTKEASGEGSIGASLKVIAAELDLAKVKGSAGAKLENASSFVSRIKFTVPIYFEGHVRGLYLEKTTFQA